MDRTNPSGSTRMKRSMDKSNDRVTSLKSSCNWFANSLQCVVKNRPKRPYAKLFCTESGLAGALGLPLSKPGRWQHPVKIIGISCNASHLTFNLAQYRNLVNHFMRALLEYAIYFSHFLQIFLERVTWWARCISVTHRFSLI